jgi:hypothetical protein
MHTYYKPAKLQFNILLQQYVLHSCNFVQSKNLYEIEYKKQYRVEVSNMFAALEDLDAEVDINSAWETIREIIRILAKEV